MHTERVFVLVSVVILFTMLTGPWTEPVSSWDLTAHKYTKLTYTERKKSVFDVSERKSDNKVKNLW